MDNLEMELMVMMGPTNPPPPFFWGGGGQGCDRTNVPQNSCVDFGK